jgi:hypothetical protein
MRAAYFGLVGLARIKLPRFMFPSRSTFCRVYFGMNPGSEAGGSVKAMRHVRVT